MKFSDKEFIEKFIEHATVLSFGLQVYSFYARKDEEKFKLVSETFNISKVKTPVDKLIAPIFPKDKSLRPTLQHVVSAYWNLLLSLVGLLFLEPDPSNPQEEFDFIVKLLAASTDYLLLGRDNNPGCNVYYLNMHA